VTTFIGAILITISTPVFYENTRSRLFHQPEIYIFASIPLLGVLLIWQLLKSLQRKEERAPFIWTILIFCSVLLGWG
jgi:cytochrome d ubiquinol oxidase subunit II